MSRRHFPLQRRNFKALFVFIYYIFSVLFSSLGIGFIFWESQWEFTAPSNVEFCMSLLSRYELMHAQLKLIAIILTKCGHLTNHNFLFYMRQVHVHR